MTDFAACPKPEGGRAHAGRAHAIIAPHLNMRSRSPIRWSRADAGKPRETVGGVVHPQPTSSYSTAFLGFPCLILLHFKSVSTNELGNKLNKSLDSLRCLSNRQPTVSEEEGWSCPPPPLPPPRFPFPAGNFLSLGLISFTKWKSRLLSSPSSHDPWPRRHRCLR